MDARDSRDVRDALVAERSKYEAERATLTDAASVQRLEARHQGAVGRLEEEHAKERERAEHAAAALSSQLSVANGALERERELHTLERRQWEAPFERRSDARGAGGQRGDDAKEVVGRAQNVGGRGRRGATRSGPGRRGRGGHVPAGAPADDEGEAPAHL